MDQEITSQVVARNLARLNDFKIGLKSRINAKAASPSKIPLTLKTLEGATSYKEDNSLSPTHSDLVDVNLIGKIVVGNNHQPNTQHISREETLIKSRQSNSHNRQPPDIGHKIFQRRQLESTFSQSKKAKSKISTSSIPNPSNNNLSSSHAMQRMVEMSEDLGQIKGAIYKQESPLQDMTLDQSLHALALKKKKSSKSKKVVQQVNTKQLISRVVCQKHKTHKVSSGVQTQPPHESLIQSIIDLNSHLRTRVEDINLSEAPMEYGTTQRLSQMNLARSLRKLSQVQKKQRQQQRMQLETSAIGSQQASIHPKKVTIHERKSSRTGGRKQSSLALSYSRQESRRREALQTYKEYSNGIVFTQLNFQGREQAQHIKPAVKTPKQITRKTFIPINGDPDRNPFFGSPEKEVAVTQDLASYIQSLQKDSSASNTLRILQIMKPADAPPQNVYDIQNRSTEIHNPPVRKQKRARYQSAYQRKGNPAGINTGGPAQREGIFNQSEFLKAKMSVPEDPSISTLIQHQPFSPTAREISKKKNSTSVLKQQLQKNSMAKSGDKRLARQRLTQGQINDDLADIIKPGNEAIDTDGRGSHLTQGKPGQIRTKQQLSLSTKRLSTRKEGTGSLLNSKLRSNQDSNGRGVKFQDMEVINHHPFVSTTQNPIKPSTVSSSSYVSKKTDQKLLSRVHHALEQKFDSAHQKKVTPGELDQFHHPSSISQCNRQGSKLDGSEERRDEGSLSKISEMKVHIINQPHEVPRPSIITGLGNLKERIAESGLNSDRRILSSAREAHFTVAQASSRAANEALLSGTSSKTRDEGMLLYQQSKDSFSNFQQYEQELLFNAKATIGAAADHDRKMLINTVQEVEKSSLALNDTVNEETQKEIELCTPSLSKKVEEEVLEVGTAFGNSIETSQIIPKQSQTPEKASQKRNAYANDGKAFEKKSSITSLKSKKGRSSRLSQSSKARRLSVDSRASKSYEASANDKLLSLKQSKLPKKRTGEETSQSHQFKSNVYDCIVTQPEPQKPKFAPSQRQSYNIQITASESSKRKPGSVLRNRPKSAYKAESAAATSEASPLKKKEVTSKVNVELSIKENDPQPEAKAKSNTSPRKKKEGSTTTQKASNKISEFLVSAKAKDPAEYEAFFKEIMGQVEEYLAKGEGLTQYQFFKVEAKIGAFLLAWKQPEGGDISMFVDKLFVVMETGKQYENLKFRQTIAEKLASLTAPPEAPGKKSSSKMQKKKKSMGTVSSAPPPPEGGSHDGEESASKPHVQINSYLLGQCLPRLLLLRQSLGTLKEKAGDTAEEMAQGLKGQLAALDKTLVNSLAQALGEEEYMVPPVKQTILYLLAYEDFEEKQILPKLSLNQVEALKACSESPFPYEIAEKVGAIQNLERAKLKISVHREAVQPRVSELSSKAKPQEQASLQPPQAVAFKQLASSDYDGGHFDKESMKPKTSKSKMKKRKSSKNLSKSFSRLKSGKRRQEASKIKVITSSEVNIFKKTDEESKAQQSAQMAERINELKCLDLDLEFGFEDDEDEEQIYAQETESKVTRNATTFQRSFVNNYQTFHKSQGDTQMRRTGEESDHWQVVKLTNPQSISFANDPSKLRTKGTGFNEDLTLGPTQLLTENDYPIEGQQTRVELKQADKQNKAGIKVISFPLSNQFNRTQGQQIPAYRYSKPPAGGTYRHISPSHAAAMGLNREESNRSERKQVYHKIASKRGVMVSQDIITQSNQNISYLMEDFHKLERTGHLDANFLPTSISEQRTRPKSGNVQSLMNWQIAQNKIAYGPPSGEKVMKKARLFSANPQRQRPPVGDPFMDGQSSNLFQQYPNMMAPQAVLKSPRVSARPASSRQPISSPKRQTLFERPIASPEQKSQIITVPPTADTKREEALESSQACMSAPEDPQPQKARRNSFMETYKQFMQVIREEKR